MASKLSQSTKSFVTVSADNRIHLWDTDTRKEKKTYVEKNHLAHSYTCSDWKQTSANSLGHFAAGCSDGVVIIWDFVRGVVSTTIGAPGQHSAPTALAFSADAKTIFVGTADSVVSQYNVKDGEQVGSFKGGKKGTSVLAMNPVVDALAIGR